MLRFDTLTLVLCLLAAASGCSKEEDKPPRAPGGKGFEGTGTGSRVDAGPDDSGRPIDSGLEVDASTVTGECQSANPGDYALSDTGSDGMLLNGIKFPSDFAATRVLGSWNANCADPAIVIELSDGKCPNGSSHKLQILFDADAIDGATPTILVGLNTLMAEPDDKGIRVSYLRPSSLSPHGRWGTCAGAPGTLELVGEPATTASTQFQGRFSFDLASCDGSGATEQVVQGSFNVTLRRGREDVCPTK